MAETRLNRVIIVEHEDITATVDDYNERGFVATNVQPISDTRRYVITFSHVANITRYMTNVTLDTMIDNIIDMLGSNKVSELVSAMKAAEKIVMAAKAESEATKVAEDIEEGVDGMN